ncbi:class I SAM-dependent DNA methyltransferase [Fodinicola acaciae]|uniref:class I SAM-dependent DNA methyltransferase n=1 Tax=Fodinicola acaciae TaxID=2681555 RepID=UPI0013D615B7|nr:class I SAM-dependent methyltransferase [Fodinicola acaciae]
MTDDVIEVYRRHAAAWIAARGTKLGERGWIERFAGLLAPGATVLDIGCGSGQPVARYLADQGHPVTGVDSSPEMISVFRKNLPDSDAVVADMRSLRLGRRFGGVIAWDSFFHLSPDQQRLMFPVFRDHAELAAPLLFTSGPAFGERIGTLEGDPLYHASLDPDDYRRLLGQCGFDVVAHVAVDPDCGGHTVWLARVCFETGPSRNDEPGP